MSLPDPVLSNGVQLTASSVRCAPASGSSCRPAIFDLDSGNRIGSEVPTKDISLTGPDTFAATMTYDLFTAARIVEGCIINETATRFEWIAHERKNPGRL